MQRLKMFATAWAVAAMLGGCASHRLASPTLPAARTVDRDALHVDRVEAGAQVAQMVLSDDGSRLYVTGNGDNTLTVVDTQAHQAEKTIDGGKFKTGLGGCPHNFCRGRGAAGVVVASDGDTAWVSSMRPDAVSRIDLGAGRRVDSVDVGRFPRDMVMSPDGRRAYVLNSVSNSISVVDLDAMTTIGEPLELIGGDARHMPFGRYLGMWLSPDGHRLFVYNAKRGTIDRFDTAQRQQTGASKVRYRFTTLAASPSRRRVAIADHNGVSIVDGSDLALEKRLGYCGSGRGSYPTMALSTGGRYLAFHMRRSRNTWVVDTRTGQAVRRYPVDGYVLGLAFSPDGAALYQLNGDDTVSFFDTATTLAIDAGRSSSGPGLCTPFEQISVEQEKEPHSF